MLKLKVLNGFYDFVKILYFTSNQYCFMNEWTSYLFSLFTDLDTNKRFTYDKDNIWLFKTKILFDLRIFSTRSSPLRETAKLQNGNFSICEQPNFCCWRHPENQENKMTTFKNTPLGLWPLSKSKFNLKSDRVNLVAPACPIECLLYLPQGYNARKVISEVYASLVLQYTVSGR